MTEELEICAICAWRATCQKKFSMSGHDTHCPDFSKDLSIGRDEDDEPKDTGEEG